jgi:hypothetical protein
MGILGHLTFSKKDRKNFFYIMKEKFREGADFGKKSATTGTGSAGPRDDDYNLFHPADACATLLPGRSYQNNPDDAAGGDGRRKNLSVPF